MKNFIKQSDTTFVRIIKSLLIGGFIGAILGSVGALFIIFGQDKYLSEINIVQYFLWVSRIVVIITALFSLIYLYQIQKYQKVFFNVDESQSEEIYRQINLRHSYGITFVSISIVLSIVNKLNIFDDSVTLVIPIYDLSLLFVLLGLHIYFLKVYRNIRGIKMTVAPTLKELKNNVLQLDEAELESNYKMCFDIVMNLSGFIFPTIYFVLFFISFVFQKVEIVAIIITTSIHIYILIKSLKAARHFYR
ncbi:TPA: DUF3169 family protein [Streptococcus agalactiae]